MNYKFESTTKNTYVLTSDTDNNITEYMLEIDIDNKNINNLYNFFVFSTIDIILHHSDECIQIDFTNLEDKDFFNENNFQKLKELIDELTEICNQTIKSCRDE